MTRARRRISSEKAAEPSTWSTRCRGKMQFTSKRQATGACRVMQQSATTHDSDHLQVYRCNVCRYWHIGNAPGSRVTMPPPLKTMHATAGDLVVIVWRKMDGSEVRTQHQAPKE